MDERTRPASSGITSRGRHDHEDPAGAGSRWPGWLRAGLAVATIGWGAQEFTPLLLLYQSRLAMSATTVQATFVPYVAGLIPGLLLGGPCSDRFGRRRVMSLTLMATALATVLLILAVDGIGWLFAGRLAAGVASGAGFSCGAAWMRELSVAGSSGSADHGPRRVTVAMCVGFGLGPLVAGALAQWAPYPTVLPYVPHLILAVAAFALVLGTPETVSRDSGTSLLRSLRLRELGGRQFRTVVVPSAPWVFIPVSIAVAFLPVLLKARISSYELIFSAVVIVVNAGAGILIQPAARRAASAGRTRLLAASLSVIAIGILIAAVAATTQEPTFVLVASLVLGSGYGSCQVYGLLEVQRLAAPGHLGGMTAVYQAVSYTGYVASYPLAALSTAFPAAAVLVAVAVCAVLTLVWTVRAAALIPPPLVDPAAVPTVTSAVPENK
jgi:MFS family permease